jgi:hypothetical protein
MMSSVSITPQTDITVRQCRDLIERARSLTYEQVYDARALAANGFMLYAHKPLPEGSDHTPWADSIRAARREAYRDLWLALDAEAARR